MERDEALALIVLNRGYAVFRSAVPLPIGFVIRETESYLLPQPFAVTERTTMSDFIAECELLKSLGRVPISDERIQTESIRFKYLYRATTD